MALTAVAACGEDKTGDPGAATGTNASDSVTFGGDSDTSACTTASECAAPTPHCSPNGTCVECLADGQCGGGRCANGICAPDACQAGEALCNGNTLLTCNGDGWDTMLCAGGVCANGACDGCVAGTRVCNGDAVAMCRGDSSGYDTVETCSGNASCLDGMCQTCSPGQRRCATPGLSEVCADGGGWTSGEDCAASGLSCLQGACVSPCVVDIKGKSNSGCDYWAVDLDNHYQAQSGPFALIVSNLDPAPAMVSISRRDGPQAQTVEVVQRQVGPNSLEVFELPQRHPGGAGIYWAAYRVQSTRPIIAYQFNPLSNVGVFSNDASLLLPVNTHGTEYVVTSRFELLGGGDNGTTLPYRGTVTVVASSETTDVQVTPTSRTLAGPNMQTMAPGQTYTYALEPYQILSIKTDQPAPAGQIRGGDLTGTVITANKRIAVFAGHEAALSDQSCCADHLEQQMFPVATWGTTYVATKAFPRLNESDYWRVVASRDNTQVTFSPAVAETQVLNRGQFFEVKSTADFVVTATQPVMVSQLLASSSEIVDPPAYGTCFSNNDCFATYSCLQTSATRSQCIPRECSGEGDDQFCLPGHTCSCFTSGNCVCSPIGDPALILQPPVEQFRKDYVFLTPDQYVSDYINIIAPVGATVVLDGNPLPAANFTAIPGSSWLVARQPVLDGVHAITATEPVGAIVYGYDRDVSYGYPAGLNLTDL
ncbi:MAG: hypothetical protein ACI9MR_000125 [Myxococcota bacterium]